MTCPGNHKRTDARSFAFDCGCGRTELCNAGPTPMQCQICAATDNTCRFCLQPLDAIPDTERMPDGVVFTDHGWRNTDEEFPTEDEAV